MKLNCGDENLLYTLNVNVRTPILTYVNDRSKGMVATVRNAYTAGEIL